MTHQPEAFSRVLIDKALTDSDWDLLNHHQVRFELRAGGRADYVLLDDKGMALCVLEAKSEDKDPYDVTWCSSPA
jgi:type I site-specific restriction endonuclease